LALADLAQIQNVALGYPSIGQAFVLDDAEILMRFTVLVAYRRAQKHQRRLSTPNAA